MRRFRSRRNFVQSLRQTTFLCVHLESLADVMAARGRIEFIFCSPDGRVHLQNAQETAMKSWDLPKTDQPQLHCIKSSFDTAM